MIKIAVSLLKIIEGSHELIFKIHLSILLERNYHLFLLYRLQDLDDTSLIVIDI